MHPIELQEKFESLSKQLSEIENIDPDALFPKFKFSDDAKEEYRFGWFDLGNDDMGISQSEISELDEEEKKQLLQNNPKNFSWMLYYLTNEQFESEPDPRTLDVACCGYSTEIDYNSVLIEEAIEKLEEELKNPQFDSEEKEQQRYERYYAHLRENAEWRNQFNSEKTISVHVIRIFYTEEIASQNMSHLIQNVIREVKGAETGATMWGCYWAEYAEYSVTKEQHQEILQKIKEIPTVSSILEIY